MRRLIFLAALLLNGCWVGTSLYAPSDAKLVVASGNYKWTTPDGNAGVAKVTMTSNGMTSMDVDGDVSLVGFVPLGADGRTFVSWSEEKGTQLYDLAVRQADATLVFYMPVCDGEQAEAARNAGATIEPGTVQTCRFSSRASLETAMRGFRPTPKQEMIRLIPANK